MFRRYITAALAITALVSACGGSSRALEAQAAPVERSAGDTWDPSAHTLDATIPASEYARILAGATPSGLAECTASSDC